MVIFVNKVHSHLKINILLVHLALMNRYCKTYYPRVQKLHDRVATLVKKMEKR